MKIKTLSDKSQYVIGEGKIFVRNFTAGNHGNDINDLYSSQDIKNCIYNESILKTMNLPGIDRENKIYSNVAIVSDGFDLDRCESLINFLGKNSIPVIGVNGCMTHKTKVIPSVYLYNSTTMIDSWFPSKVTLLPPCIVSTRSSPEFAKKYKSRNGLIYTYTPTPSKLFQSNIFNPTYTIDDYRNPICAAINFAFRWSASRIILLSPHDLYKEHRPGTEKINDNLHIYPQQKIAHNFIDSCFYWMKNIGCEIWAVTSGPKFQNAEIMEPETIMEKFKEGPVE